MLQALVMFTVLGCWDAERIEVPGSSLTLECHEECPSWSLDRAQWLTTRRLWALQVFAGSEAGAWRALSRVEDRVPAGAYWVQGHPGRARQGGLERVRLASGRWRFRAIAAVFATRGEALKASAGLGESSFVRPVTPALQGPASVPPSSPPSGNTMGAGVKGGGS